MSKASGQQTESSIAQEGKHYGYQQPQGPGESGALTVSEVKEQLLDAFEQLIDAMLATHSGSGAGQPGTTGGQGTQGGYGAQGGRPSSGTPGTPSGQGAEGGYGKPGAEAGQPTKGESSHEKTSTSWTTDGAKGAAAHEAALEVPVAVLRESYRQDRARRQAMRRPKRAAEPPAATPAGVGGGNKHQSDSNKAPLQTTQEFAPSFGNRGRSKSESMEVQTMPSGRGERPENAPAPPQSNAVALDAYWASFGTPWERAQERARVASAMRPKDSESYQVMELIIGTDDRVLVTNNEAYPWRCICSLLITAQTGGLYLGTGWLVSPRLVLTAGHCVYMADEGGWASEIEVIPGRNGTSRPFGSVTSGDLRSVTGWTVDNDRDYDYGAILLPEGRRYGDELGWFGYSTRSDDYLRNITLNLSGYPGDGGKAGPERQQGTQWFNSRSVKDVFDRQITYEIDTWGGHSGAPVWEMTSEGYRYGLAIHTWGTEVSNGATRIISEVFDNIVQWAGEVP